MSSASSVLPSDLVSVEVAAQQVGAHPQTSLTRCTFPVLYPVLAPERGPRWQTHAQRRNLGTSVRRPTTRHRAKRSAGSGRIGHGGATDQIDVGSSELWMAIGESR